MSPRRYSLLDREPADTEPLGFYGWLYAIGNVVITVLWLALGVGWILEFAK